MTKSLPWIFLYSFLALCSFPVCAEGTSVTVPMQARPSGTYYLKVGFGDTVSGEFMLDTGSEFLVINENTLENLLETSKAKYLYDITGVMADGSELKVPVYRLSSLSIGCCCVIQHVAAAVLPGNTREILGLTALKKVAPFGVSLEPAELTLNNCGISTASRTTPINPGHPDDVSGLSEIASMTKNQATSLLP